MKQSGTILPTSELLARADAHADAVRVADEKIGASIPGCTRRVEQGQVRFYRSPTQFATVRNGKIKWFEHRGDGIWPTTQPQG
jgi:hypothetical protein